MDKFWKLDCLSHVSPCTDQFALFQRNNNKQLKNEFAALALDGYKSGLRIELWVYEARSQLEVSAYSSVLRLSSVRAEVICAAASYASRSLPTPPPSASTVRANHARIHPTLEPRRRRMCFADYRLCGIIA